LQIDPTLKNYLQLALELAKVDDDATSEFIDKG
jgi:hypothetical protein